MQKKCCICANVTVGQRIEEPHVIGWYMVSSYKPIISAIWLFRGKPSCASHISLLSLLGKEHHVKHHHYSQLLTMVCVLQIGYILTHTCLFVVPIHHQPICLAGFCFITHFQQALECMVQAPLCRNGADTGSQLLCHSIWTPLHKAADLKHLISDSITAIIWPNL